MATKRERGAYRPIYAAIIDGGDFQSLSADARLLLLVLKLSLPAAGIDVLPGFGGQMEERTGMPTPRVYAARDELVEQQWVEYERAIYWLVRGLEFEPNLSVGDIKHRASIANHIEGLPRLAIVERFRARYPEWVGASYGVPTPSEGPSQPLASTKPEPKPKPEPEPATAPRAVAAGLSPAFRVTVAANRAANAKWGEPPTPYLAQSSHATKLADDLEAAAVPLEFVEAAFPVVVERIAARPNTQRYFAKPLIQAWQAQQASDAAGPSAPPSTSLEREMREAARRAERRLIAAGEL